MVSRCCRDGKLHMLHTIPFVAISGLYSHTAVLFKPRLCCSWFPVHVDLYKPTSGLHVLLLYNTLAQQAPLRLGHTKSDCVCRNIRKQDAPQPAPGEEGQFIQEANGKPV